MQITRVWSKFMQETQRRQSPCARADPIHIRPIWQAYPHTVQTNIVWETLISPIAWRDAVTPFHGRSLLEGIPQCDVRRLEGSGVEN